MITKKTSFILFVFSGFVAISLVLLTYFFLQNSFHKNEALLQAAAFVSVSKEGCIKCHSDVMGIEQSHLPERIGCFACHLGNPNSLDKEEAHKNMVLIPGNFSDIEKTCGSPNCHPQMISRMKNNIMNTMNGVVTVDKWVFEEANSPTFKNQIQTIGFSVTEKHLRNLCASCHLANIKSEYGPITELSRGGGCLACHLNYSQNAIRELGDKAKIKKLFHPNVSLKIDNMKCFGCHSRSGRISLSYDGWHETMLKPEEVKSNLGFRTLDDGRVVRQIQKDIHSEKGLLCVDCHTSEEIMGDGNYYFHKEDQLKIKCIDCHRVNKANVKTIDEFDFESSKISELLKLNDPSKKYILTTSNNSPLVNVFSENDKTFLIKKTSKQAVEIKKPILSCTGNKAHKNLSCNACHSSWTPQCIGCHTEYDNSSTMYDLLANKEAEGEWLEFSKSLLAENSTLGIKEIKKNDGTIEKEIIEVMPGMILDIKKGSGEKTLFKRLFAPAFSHTIRKESRSCIDCHTNSLTLGYGRGKLDYVNIKNKGYWKFSPLYPIVKYDGLPEDAWIQFLKERKHNSATRENIRSFSINEQKKILTVGACLLCHNENSAIIKAALNNFEKILNLTSSKCLLPYWL